MDKIKKRKLFALCVLGTFFFMVASLVPSLAPVPPADAAVAAITITKVTPTELQPGDEKEVTITVKNDGGIEAKNIRLVCQPTEFISFIGPTSFHKNSLYKWESREGKIKVRVADEAPNGVYAVPITASWQGYYFDPARGYVLTNLTTAEVAVSFNVVGHGLINIGHVSSDPTDIKPGDNSVKLTVAIENSGEAAVKDVTSNLNCPEGFKPSWSGTDRSYIGRLNSGDSKEAIFHIDVAKTVAAGPYSIPLAVKYRDIRGGEHEVMRSVDILVKVKPEFDIVSYYTVPENISAGDTGLSLQVKIKNVGSSKAESVSVRVTGEADVPFTYDVKSDHVGNLDINEEGDAILKFDVDKEAVPRIYRQNIEIRCTGDRDLNDNEVYIFAKDIPLEVKSGGSSIPGFSGLFTILALVFVFLFVVRKKGV
ncbi:hypothetical protein C5S36_02695 [Candidatus Methanophagaceae archaeon]|nr:hypothetical protein C5S36_02695 [Methanophagales archaeon]